MRTKTSSTQKAKNSFLYGSVCLVLFLGDWFIYRNEDSGLGIAFGMLLFLAPAILCYLFALMFFIASRISKPSS